MVVMRGLIDRRILANYRVDPALLARQLPAPFRPKLVHGWAMVGVCLIRLRALRPSFLPTWMGMVSESAAHRAAVEWDDHGVVREGVYVRRRDTSSRFFSLLGGRAFPGIQHHAAFTVAEADGRLDVALRSDDGITDIDMRSRIADTLPADSIFKTMAEASAFFEAGALGYSPDESHGQSQGSTTARPARFHGIELRCRGWAVQPLAVERLRSSHFDDPGTFPPGSIIPDCALVMRGIDHEWHAREDLCCPHASATTPLACPAPP